MSQYLDIITLEQAKLYLRIDDCQSETDTEIEQMIKSALAFCEKRTNHILFPRDKQYFGCVHVFVFDYPINNLPSDAEQSQMYSKVYTSGGSVTLNIGYTDSEDIPSEIIDVALQIIKVWYYEAENKVNTSIIPATALEVLDTIRRFV